MLLFHLELNHCPYYFLRYRRLRGIHAVLRIPPLYVGMRLRLCTGCALFRLMWEATWWSTGHSLPIHSTHKSFRFLGRRCYSLHRGESI